MAFRARKVFRTLRNRPLDLVKQNLCNNVLFDKLLSPFFPLYFLLELIHTERTHVRNLKVLSKVRVTLKALREILVIYLLSKYSFM